MTECCFNSPMAVTLERAREMHRRQIMPHPPIYLNITVADEPAKHIRVGDDFIWENDGWKEPYRVKYREVMPEGIRIEAELVAHIEGKMVF